MWNTCRGRTTLLLFLATLVPLCYFSAKQLSSRRTDSHQESFHEPIPRKWTQINELGGVRWSCLENQHRGTDMTIAHSATTPRFAMWLPQMHVDPMISASLHLTGAFDLHVLAAVAGVVKNTCTLSAPVEASPLVVDVGAHVGFFSLFMASQGCQTLAFEPQTALVASLKTSACLNGLSNRLTVKEAAITNDTRLNMYYDGMFVRDQRLVDTCEAAGGRSRCRRVASSVGLDNIYPTDIILLAKIDASGMEEKVLRSMDSLLADQRVLNIVLNYHPQFLGQQASVSLLRKLDERGYSVFYLPFIQEGVSSARFAAPLLSEVRMWRVASMTLPDAPFSIQVRRVPESSFGCFPDALRKGRIEKGRHFGDLYIVPKSQEAGMLGGHAKHLQPAVNC
eukprot:jgi/Bigna1/78938/fgenesh1_pg.58_\